MDYREELERLNPQQREAVLDDSPACIVNANVGSGKTTVLISKVLYLHHEKQIPYKDMIVLTFTNKAANEIRERLSAAEAGIPDEELDGFGTFHSVALKMLKSDLPVEELGYTREFLVIGPEEEIDMALQIIQRENLKVKYKNRLKKRLEQKKAANYKDDFPELVKQLKTEKVRQNKMTFSDLLYNACELLEESVEKPAWIIIDEVQDSDSLQLEFIDALKGVDSSVFAVGDPNQVIYSWRGSELNVVYALKHKYGARELALPYNYRSSNTILEAAKKFQQNGSALAGTRETGSRIVIRNHYNPFQEAGYLADKIAQLHREGIAYRDIAVFYRLQEQSRNLEQAMQRAGIPFDVSLKKGIRDIPVLNWLVKLLRCSVNAEDDTSAVLVLADKNYGEGFTAKKAAALWDAAAESGSGLLSQITKFRDACGSFHNAEEIYRYYELDHRLKPTSASYHTDREAVQDLLEIIQSYTGEQGLSLVDGVQSFVNAAALWGIDILKNDTDSSRNTVKLMTLHAAKGLEFSHVFIIGVNHGLIPLQARSFEEEEEERRLFFVGMTRAEDYLELSWYTDAGEFRAAPGESRYLKMLPEHLVQREDIPVQKTDLQELKRQVLEARKNMQDEATAGGQAEERAGAQVEVQDENAVKSRTVRHKKYGTGHVIGEDEEMITVEFEGIGRKEFLKMFSDLEFQE